MGPLDLVNLTPLMARTSGRAEIKIGFIEGPLALDHPDLAAHNIHEVQASNPGARSTASSLACLHRNIRAERLGRFRSNEPHRKEAVMVKKRAARADATELRPDRQPHRVRSPGFLIDEEIALGDVKRATYAMGIQPCGGYEWRRLA